jgi:hypothetical protein
MIAGIIWVKAKLGKKLNVSTYLPMTMFSVNFCVSSSVFS